MLHSPYSALSALLVVIAQFATFTPQRALSQSQSPKADSFNPGANSPVYSLAVQADGKILVGGGFTSLGGQARNRIGRLNADGTLDTAFNPGAGGDVNSLAVQVDGKILVGGYFTSLSGQARYYLGRLNPDGTLDTAFNPVANSTVDSLTLQADGKILVGGYFGSLGGQTRNYLGRLNADGTLDTAFNPGANNTVDSLALQADGKILVGGYFSSLGGGARNHIGRLNADGTLDTAFNPGADNTVASLAVQADGKILVGGNFINMGGGTRYHFGRLIADGTLDTGFNPGADSSVLSMAVQSDGKILVGGNFTSLGGQTRVGLGRVNADGTLDTAFSPGANNSVASLAVQADGEILAGGYFTSLGGQSRNWIGRLNHTEPATQRLSYDGSKITWLRGGTSPEVWRTSFEYSTNGSAWSSVGAGSRISGGWQLTNVALAWGNTIRARGFATGGQFNGSSWFGESMLGPPIIISPLAASGKQGEYFACTVTCTNQPTGFGATGLPPGLSMDGTNGVISGVPSVSGDFSVVITATNYFGVDTRTVTLTLAAGLPAITSSLSVVATQGLTFNYVITATNNPTGFTASGLPEGLSLRADTGVLSGIPTVAGRYDVLVSATNLYGADIGTLQILVVSGEPQITNATVVTGTELMPFTYTLTTYPPATGYSVVGLVPGLTFNATNGTISGTPVYAGTNYVQVVAWNAYGTNSASVEIRVAYAPVTGLVITDLDYAYSRPYLLDFTFSLRDGTNPITAHAVVRPPASLSVTCLENGVPIDPLETAFVVEKGDRRQFKAYLVLDYTRSMTAMSNGDADGNQISDAIDNMQSAAMEFLRQLPSTAQVGLYEFHADWEDPTRLLRPTSDRAALDTAIDSIWAMMQLPDASGGSRCWDALLAAVNEFGEPDPDENRYVIFISDGNDTSSVVSYTNVIAAAQAKKVRLYCVAFGQLIDAATLGQLTIQTGGRYFRAQDPASLAGSFALLGKDLDGQYLLRWATLRRNSTPFTPSFQISVDGRTNQATSSSNYVASSYGTNREVFYGALRLVADSEENADAILLRTTYAPRNIRSLRIHYRPDYPCQAVLLLTNVGEILHGWTMSETNDSAGTHWLEINSPDPAQHTNDIPYGALGNLLYFQFTGLPSSQNAFSLFEVDNTVYASLPGPPSFNLYGADQFLTTNPPPAILSGSLGFAGGHFGFDLSGLTGQIVIIEGSTNLVAWTALQTNTMGAVPYHFSDPASTSLPARFYRARLP